MKDRNIILLDFKNVLFYVAMSLNLIVVSIVFIQFHRGYSMKIYTEKNLNATNLSNIVKNTNYYKIIYSNDGIFKIMNK